MATYALIHGAGDSSFHWHLLEPMVPLPGEWGEEWPANTGFPGPDGKDEIEIFYDDLPEEVARAAIEGGRSQADAPGKEPWPLEAWPQVPTRYLLCLRDRMFPAAWMRDVVRQRLGIEPDEIDSGHCPALSRPQELAARLEAYRSGLGLE